MKILGIGNAIVDVICKIEDEFLLKNQLTKSTMKLVDKNEFQKLLTNLKIEETVSSILKVESSFLNSTSSTSFIVLFVNPFLDR